MVMIIVMYIVELKLIRTSSCRRTILTRTMLILIFPIVGLAKKLLS